MEMTSRTESAEDERQSVHAPYEPSPGPRTLTSAATGLTTPSIGRWAKVHWGLLLVALVVLVKAGQGQHFYFDEWAFLGQKQNALPFPDNYLVSHNEHWSTLPLLAYRTLGATVGIGSYWPYLG